MTIERIMLTEPLTVGPQDTVPHAMQLMLHHGIRNLPVVDAGGRFLGSFSTSNLIRLLLPRAATMDSDHYGRIFDITFVHDTLGDIRDRLHDVRSHVVGDYMSTENIPIVAPNCSLMEAMLLLYQHRTHVPVVDPGSKRLLGVVTFNSVLKIILEAD